LHTYQNRIIIVRHTSNSSYVVSPYPAYINNLKYEIFILKEENLEASLIDLISFEAMTQNYKVEVQVSP